MIGPEHHLNAKDSDAVLLCCTFESKCGKCFCRITCNVCYVLWYVKYPYAKALYICDNRFVSIGYDRCDGIF